MVIGVIGGMGSYATLHFFERYLKVFPAEKEWDRPRIIIDNRCTMPSRVRAILYGERYDQVVGELVDSAKRLSDAGCTHIISACGTSHVFLDAVAEQAPDVADKIVNILDMSATTLKKCGTTKVSLLATEGSIQSGIYQKTYQEYGIEIETPKDNDLPRFRAFIEAVKKNEITFETVDQFTKLLNEQIQDTVVLGCTEFPVLYSRVDVKKMRKGLVIVDPLEAVLASLKLEYGENTEKYSGGL